MRIDDKHKISHIKWLGINVITHCSNALIKSSQRNNKLEISIEPRPHGRNISIAGPLRFKFSRCYPVSQPLYWKFLETWEQSFVGQGHKAKYELVKVTIVLYRRDDKELFSIHWNKSQETAGPYEPHYHLKSKNDTLYFGKIHFPLNNSWGIYYAKDINEYHRWINGLLRFIDTEFIRCLAI